MSKSQYFSPLNRQETSPSKLRLQQLSDKLSGLQFGSNEEQLVTTKVTGR